MNPSIIPASPCFQQTPTASLRETAASSRHYRRKVTHRRARSGSMQGAARAPVDNFTRRILQPS